MTPISCPYLRFGIGKYTSKYKLRMKISQIIRVGLSWVDVGDINGYAFIQKEIRSNKLPDPFIRYIS